METKQKMNKTIRHLLHDIERISGVVREVEEELITARPSSLTTKRIVVMKEKLGEVHARLDGVHEFILTCQREAAEKPAIQEVDVWL
jgi:cob(I)alamin adenosyltransferase